MDEKPDNMAQIFGFTFLCHVIMAVAINYVGSGYDFKSGLVLGIMFSLVMMSMFAMNVLYENRPKEILVISGGYYSVCIIITSVILAIW